MCFSNASRNVRMVDIVSARVLVVAQGTGLVIAVKQVTQYRCVLGSCEATEDSDDVMKDHVTITDFCEN